MSDTVIKVENLSKLYAIQHRNGDNGLRHAIHDFATAPLRWLRLQQGAWSKEHGEKPFSLPARCSLLPAFLFGLLDTIRSFGFVVFIGITRTALQTL